MKVDAVFEGGGMRGIGIVGALRYFEKKGYVWRKTAGTSAGAVIAAMVAAGYTSKELEKILVDTDFTRFLDREGMQRIPLVGKALGFFKDKGIYSGEYFENWMYELLKAKGIEKFKDVCCEGESKLNIIASDITLKKMLVIPEDLSYYGLDPFEFSIARAVRMSISIPFYFKPIELKHKYGISYIVDGGICCNYPINIFDSKEELNIPTIGFKFDSNMIGYTYEGKKDAMSFLFDIADTMSAETNGSNLSERDKYRTVFIPTLGVETTEFNISKQKSVRIFQSGYRAARKFLKKWDFEKYLNEYCKDKKMA